MKQSFVDPCVLNRGPRLYSTSSYIYPIQCPQILANDCPVHPSTHFVRREECSLKRIAEYEQNLRENCEAIFQIILTFQFMNLITDFRKGLEKMLFNLFAMRPKKILQLLLILLEILLEPELSVQLTWKILMITF
jgi:hypothetical protein